MIVQNYFKCSQRRQYFFEFQSSLKESNHKNTTRNNHFYLLKSLLRCVNIKSSAFNWEKCRSQSWMISPENLRQEVHPDLVLAWKFLPVSVSLHMLHRNPSTLVSHVDFAIFKFISATRKPNLWIIEKIYIYCNCRLIRWWWRCWNVVLIRNQQEDSSWLKLKGCFHAKPLLRNVCCFRNIDHYHNLFSSF